MFEEDIYKTIVITHSGLAILVLGIDKKTKSIKGSVIGIEEFNKIRFINN